MTKKHFIALADLMISQFPIGGHDAALQQWCSDKHALADFCQAQNPRFNRLRWLGYIDGLNGPNGGAVKKAKAA